ncbi:hypothetical protein ASG40_11160 [Methylobacterium sp. Leaf399]|uniref:hypothetical protein n=1 Tax=Methylobacterium sp. Leaf399 TaxID=1736364 RepID=UPI0006FE5B9E|nr:hypothetical protein [Methylobacterium sp. Leaf399]KQT09187.1 hypothetical protein ASG40_11160 [Methylobacterium sp. Leaf399]
MALFGLGRSARPPANDGPRRRVEAWVRPAAGLDEADVVKVNEILCPDPACPGFETVILIMRPGERTRALKVPKPIAAVTQADVADALTG